MNQKTIAVVVVIAVSAILGYLSFSDPSDRDAARNSAEASNQAARGHATLGTSTRNADRPTARSLTVLVASPVSAPSLRDKLVESFDWRQLFDQIDSMTNVPEKERLLYKAVILETCSLRDQALATEKAVGAYANTGTLHQLVDYVGGFMRDERQKQAMAYNMQHRIVNVCRGFQSTISKEDVAYAYMAAATAGSSAAQAHLVSQQLADSAQRNSSKVPSEYAPYLEGRSGSVGFSDPLTATQRDTLVSALFSQDPVAIREAGMVLSAGTLNQSLRFGPDQVDPGLYSNYLWTLVACQFGLECGAQNMDVSAACAEQRKCAEDYASYLQTYVLTPTQYQIVQTTAQGVVDAIRRQDNSAFLLVDQPGTHRTLLGAESPRITIR